LELDGQAVKTLLDLKVKPDVRNSEGKTALELAVASKDKCSAIQEALTAYAATSKTVKSSKGKQDVTQEPKRFG
jgi:ankyrin repeat protein